MNVIQLVSNKRRAPLRSCDVHVYRLVQGGDGVKERAFSHLLRSCVTNEWLRTMRSLAASTMLVATQALVMPGTSLSPALRLRTSGGLTVYPRMVKKAALPRWTEWGESGGQNRGAWVRAVAH